MATAMLIRVKVADKVISDLIRKQPAQLSVMACTFWELNEYFSG